MGDEVCDDNVTNIDGWRCWADCRDQFVGWNCVNVTDALGNIGPTNCVEICGDGLKVGAEGCDDGTKTDGWGC